MRLHIHRYIYVGYSHLECMPNDEEGIAVYSICQKCHKEKDIVYIKNKVINPKRHFGHSK